MRTYYVYILSSKTRRLYVGITSDLERRVQKHKEKLVDGFTSRYNIDRLVSYEEMGTLHDAIFGERQIKAWRRDKKVSSIESENPAWCDLTSDGLGA